MGGEAAGALELLVFDLGGRTYGLPATDVVELLRAVAIAPLPNGPRVVTGLINLRGRVVPVFDLRVRFGIASPSLETSDHFIVARARRRTVAIHVEQTMQLVKIAREDVTGAERIVMGAQYISGVATMESGIVLIHDLDSFLSQAEEATLDVALQRALEAP